ATWTRSWTRWRPPPRRSPPTPADPPRPVTRRAPPTAMPRTPLSPPRLPTADTAPPASAPRLPLSAGARGVSGEDPEGAGRSPREMLDCTSEGGEREAGAPVPPLTVGAALARAAGRLARAGVEEASLEAQLLLAHASGLERARLLAHPELPLERVAADGFRDLIARRTRGVPLAYLTGWREFYGRPFQVSPAALIPRPESELLVDLALEELRRFAAETR